MKRWLLLPIGLAIAAIAGYALVTLSGSGGSATEKEIDDATRAQLESILREADREEGP